MATPGTLVLTMAEALGISAATVAQFDRVLAENGLRSKGGRGTSAAKINARDAANLLIAILGSPLEGAAIKDAAHTCRSYGSLPILPRVSHSKAFRQFGLRQIASMQKKHTFSDVIQTLIASAKVGDDFFIPNDDGTPITGVDPHFAITVQCPQPWASIEVAFEFAKDLSPPWPRLVYTNPAANKGRAFYGDLHQQRVVSFKVIRSLSTLIRMDLNIKEMRH